MLVEDCGVFLLDELVALLESSREETNVFEGLTIEHFNNEFEDLIMEIPNVQVVISLAISLLV